jgi:predicted ATP-grasp superfamily ATP-dependent carboligase
MVYQPLVRTEIRNLLVIGVDSVFVAASAKSAGYNVYVVDYFDDIDLQQTCVAYESIKRHKNTENHRKVKMNFNPRAFLKMAKTLSKKHHIDAVLLSSGLDDYDDILCELNEIVPILGNSPEIIRGARERKKFFDALEKLGVPHPETVVVENLFEAKKAAAGMGYPVVVKPSKGFGGVGVRLASNPLELEKVFRIAKIGGDVVVQKLIKGVHASISILAGKRSVQVLSINEQLLGLPSVYQREPFGYCGNIVPLQVAGSIFEKCKLIAEKIALHFGLKGSNGIDIVISSDGTPYVIEVNPRFQGTLGCIEKVFGLNLVNAHVKACLCDELPVTRPSSKFCTRLILYAPNRVITPDLTTLRGIWNIPPPHSIIEKGEPLCSVLTEGENREASLHKAESIAKVIYSKLQSA